MPTNVVKTQADEEKWQKAKAIAAAKGEEENYAYIMGIYKRMNPERFKSAQRVASRYAAETFPEMQAAVDRLYKDGAIDYPIEVRYFGPIGSGNVEIQLLMEGRPGAFAGRFFTTKVADGWDRHQSLKGLSPDCLKAYTKVRRKHPDAGLWTVDWAFLKDKRLAGHGLGRMAYEKILHEAGKFGAVVAPAWCATGGSTGPMADRVWKGVAKRHPTEGPVVIPRNLQASQRVASRYASSPLIEELDEDYHSLWHDRAEVAGEGWTCSLKEGVDPCGKMTLKEFIAKWKKHGLKAVKVQRLPTTYSYYDCGSHATLRTEQMHGVSRGNLRDLELDWNTPIPWSKAKKGDWVKWGNHHHGVVIDPKRKIVESCWGVDGWVFQHPVDLSTYGGKPTVHSVRLKEKTASSDGQCRVASSPFSELSPEGAEAFGSFCVSLTYWLGMAQYENLNVMYRIWKGSKELQGWLSRHVNKSSYTLYYGRRIKDNEKTVSVGDILSRKGRGKVFYWSTNLKTATAFAALDVYGNPPDAPDLQGAVGEAKVSGKKVIVDVDRFISFCTRHKEDVARLVYTRDAVAVLTGGEDYEGEVLTTPVNATVIRAEFYADPKRKKEAAHNKEARYVVAYHGSNVPIRRFDRSKAAMGVFWFSDDKGAVERGEKANRTDWLMTARLDVGSKIAGWDEYDKLGLYELERQFDSVHLDDDWIIFDSSKIKVLKMEEIDRGRRASPSRVVARSKSSSSVKVEVLPRPTEKARKSYGKTIAVGRFKSSIPLFRVMDGEELRQVWDTGDIKGGEYSVPGERAFGAQWGASLPEVAKWGHTQRGKRLGHELFVAEIDGNGRVFAHLNGANGQLQPDSGIVDLDSSFCNTGLGCSTHVQKRKVKQWYIVGENGSVRKATPSEIDDMLNEVGWEPREVTLWMGHYFNRLPSKIAKALAWETLQMEGTYAKSREETREVRRRQYESGAKPLDKNKLGRLLFSYLGKEAPAWWETSSSVAEADALPSRSNGIDSFSLQFAIVTETVVPYQGADMPRVGEAQAKQIELYIPALKRWERIWSPWGRGAPLTFDDNGIYAGR
jgi:hypothetical protein